MEPGTWTTDEWAPFILYSIVVACWTTVLLVKCRRSANKEFLFAGVARACEGCASIWRGQEHTDERVAQRLIELRVNNYIMYVGLYTNFAGFHALIFVLRATLGLERLNDSVQSLLMTITYFGSWTGSAVPSLINAKTVWIWHTCYNVVYLSFWSWSAFTSRSFFVNHYDYVVLGRLVTAILYPVARVNLFWNMIWVVVSTYFSASLDETDGCSLPFFHIVQRELFIFFFLSYGLFLFEGLQIDQVNSDLKASGYLRARKTMERLLATMCDAVVELDGNLTIREPCPRLAGLLIRHGGLNALRDEPFLNLVLAVEDRDRFEDFVLQRAVPIQHEEALAGDEQAQSIYLNLPDAYGTPVEVQLFHSCHQDEDGEICHIVGVREVPENNRGGAPDTIVEGGIGSLLDSNAESASVAPSRAGSLRDLGDGTESVISGTSEASTSTSFTAGTNDGSTGIRLAPLIPQDQMPEPRCVMFNGATFEVIACTIGFQSLTGPLIFKSNLSEVLINFNEFQRWAGNEANIAIHGLGEPAELTLKVSPSANKKEASEVEFHVVARIVEVQHADGRPMIWVRLAFSEPAKLGPSLTVRNTWLAQDAALRGECELVRKGICFVYDLAGVGRRNVSFDLPAVALAMWGATSHPVHISRVWLLDAPKIFMAAWKAGSHLVPSYIRETVRFLSTDSVDRARCLRLICHQDQLPVYLGGDPDRFGGRFDSWIFQRLQGWELAYRPVT